MLQILGVFLFVFLNRAPAFAEAPAVSCGDVALYDLRNTTLSVKDAQALATNATDEDALAFKDGSFETKDDPAAEKPDWRYEIVSDFIMRPTSKIKLRVVKVFENHLTGSGSWDRVMIFSCAHGSLEKIWQRRLAPETSLKQVNELQFKLSGKAKGSDFGLYQWDPRHNTFSRR